MPLVTVSRSSSKNRQDQHLLHQRESGAAVGLVAPSDRVQPRGTEEPLGAFIASLDLTIDTPIITLYRLDPAVFPDCVARCEGGTFSNCANHHPMLCNIMPCTKLPTATRTINGAPKNSAVSDSLRPLTIHDVPHCVKLCPFPLLLVLTVPGLILLEIPMSAFVTGPYT